jgi:hypothetical protein
MGSVYAMMYRCLFCQLNSNIQICNKYCGSFVCLICSREYHYKNDIIEIGHNKLCTEYRLQFDEIV